MKLRPASAYGQVLVVMGGSGSEREVSLDGGRQVVAALADQGIASEAVDGIPALLEALQAGTGDRVFNLLHGRGGEDGVLQGALSALGVPCTGSGVLGSALSMHKALSKRVWLQHGLPTADFVMADAGDGVDELLARIELPVVVKPPSEGSSVGISIVREADQLGPALKLARQYEARVMLERFVAGSEYTVGILGGRALPVVRIQPARAFYDYRAKYEDEATGYFCPSGLSGEAEATLRELGLAAFAALHCCGWGRVDFIGRDGVFHLLEANTTPGMTSHSLVPKAAAADGIGFSDLCRAILDTSFAEETR